MDKKRWWRSKTLWVNLVAGLALVGQSQFEFIIDPEAQAGILVFVNLVLRLVAKEAVGLKDDPPGETPGATGETTGATGATGAGQ